MERLEAVNSILIDLKTIELKFLRRLLEQGGRSDIANLSPNRENACGEARSHLQEASCSGLGQLRQRCCKVHYLARWSNAADARYDKFAGDA